jgi:hypothetical protein
MPTQPSGELGRILDRGVARLRALHVLRAAAAGCAAGAAAMLIARALHVSKGAAIGAAGVTALAAAAVAFSHLRRERTAAAAARAFERTDSSLRNLVITAEELTRKEDAPRPYMRARVLADAARRAASIDASTVVPLSRDVILALGSALVAAAAVFIRLPANAASITGSPNPQIARPSAPTLTVDIAPPSYTGRPAQHLREPAAIDALAGSEATVRLEGLDAPVIRLNGTVLASSAGSARAMLTESGYLAIDAGSVHRLLPLTVTPDRAPDVRITAPAKDLRVAGAATTIPIAAEAVDDLGLRTLEFRYTVVSGTGEQFTFTEGSLPVTLARGSEQSWRADAVLALDRMKLEPGDALIYRAVAADRRPGDAGVASSDTFFVEIAGPGDVPLEGVDMPPDKERYALSQAMIVLKIQRLQAKERSMARHDVEEAAANIAAEQRAVRANFIFLLGGEVEDEEVEAERSHEIQEGRLANQARREIATATLLMGRVERELAAVSTKQALPPAQEAVKALQRAFGHSRYLLRALPARVRLDPARRLSGDLAAAESWTRALAPTAADPAVTAARAALMDLVAVTRDLAEPAQRQTVFTALTRLAERILAMSPGPTRQSSGHADLQAAAREVIAARDAVSAGQIETARAALQRAAGPIVSRAQGGRIEAARVPRDAARLAGAAAIGPGGRR